MLHSGISDPPLSPDIHFKVCLHYRSNPNSMKNGKDSPYREAKLVCSTM